jgi:tripartite-type tricarboxylate transporter receptor subunit TctC
MNIIQHFIAPQLIAVACVAAGSLLTPSSVSAQQDWPAGKVISWVVPYPPGGSTDILGRALAQRLSASVGSQVVVENKAGATGTIGGAAVVKANPDGLTILGTTIGPQSIAPHLMPKLAYEPFKDLAPVVLIGTIPHVLVTATSHPYKSVQELLAAARAKPGQLAFASGGNGTILQMQAELLAQRNGVSFVHVPYKGDTPALQDTLGGQVHFMFAPVAAAMAHIQSGRLRALAVTSASRLKPLADIPTMSEAGQKDFVIEQWQAVYYPSKTPAAIVQKLNTELNAALKEPGLQELANKLGVTLVGGSPQQLDQRQKSDSAIWGQVIRSANIKID